MTNTNTTEIALTWIRPELLADATAWACKDNAIELLREDGLPVTNETVGDFCADAIGFLAPMTSADARRLLAGYRAVRAALGE